MKNDREFTEEMLADGSTLRYIKHRFLSKKTKEQRDWLLACIRDSKMIVPRIPISKKPDLMETDDGVRYLPLFSQEQEMPPDYMEEFVLEKMGIEECVELAKSIEGTSGLVLDPFTEPMIMEYGLLDVILKMPSRLHK